MVIAISDVRCYTVNWDLFNTLCTGNLIPENFKEFSEPIADFISSLIEISKECIPQTSTNPTISNPGRQWLNGSIVQILFVQVYPLCISSTGDRKSTTLKCSLVGLHGGWGAWKMNQTTKLHD